MKQKKIHIKNGDIVQIISGKHKGHVGKIKQILHNKSHVIIENVNIKTKHLRPKEKEDSGQIINFEAPIHSSNVMLYSTEYKIRSRYKTQINKEGTKYRVLNKTQETFK